MIARRFATRSANVRLLWKTFVGVLKQKNAKSVPVKIEHAAAQRRRPTKARASREAEWEVDCFFIAVVGLTSPLVIDARRSVNVF